MRLTMHSRDGLFKKNLKGYCQEKLTRPIERHRLDDDATRLDIDGQTVQTKSRFASASLFLISHR